MKILLTYGLWYSVFIFIYVPARGIDVTYASSLWDYL